MSRAIVYEPLRFSKVPWLLDSADLRTCMLPSSTVEHGERVTMGWFIADPFGRATSRVLRVTTADWRNAEPTLSISDGVLYEAPEPTTRVTKASFYPPQMADDNGCNDPGD